MVSTDNFLGDPTQCTFNPQTLFASILTPTQITAITNVYNGVDTAPGFAPGYEWGNETQVSPANITEPTLTTTPATSRFLFGNGAFTYFTQNTPATFNPLLDFQYQHQSGNAQLVPLFRPPAPAAFCRQLDPR